MQIKDFLKPAAPHLIAVATFIVLSVAYFYPVLEGKMLKANDSTVSLVNSKEIWDFRAKYGKEPLWTNSIFGGMPAYLISPKYPGNLFTSVDSTLRVLGMPISVLILSMAGFYLMLILFGVNPWISIAGSIGYGLSSFLLQILAAGHNTQAIALAYMAPMIGSVWYAYRKDAIKGALLTAFFLALEIVSDHPQMTYYAMMCLLVFIITEFVFAVKEKAIMKFLKTSAILVIPMIIAVGINFAFLYTTYEYGKYSTRSKSELTAPNINKSTGLDRDYIVYWSYGISESMNLLIPDFMGGSSDPFDRSSETAKALRQNGYGDQLPRFSKYWGTQPGTSGPHYVGAIFIFLFVLGLVVVKGREKWWLLAATILSLMLAWGKNFMPFTNLFIDYFPGYNKFRSVTFILVIAQFCIPALGILALRDIFRSETPVKDLIRSVLIASGVTGGILLLILVIPGLAGSFVSSYENQFPAWLRTAIVDDRKHLLAADTFRSLVFVILSSGVILGFLYKKIKPEYAIAVLGLLILADLWLVDRRYLNSDNFEHNSNYKKSLAPTAADSFILKDTSYYRVWNSSVSTFNDNSPTSYYHKSIGGYHGAKMKRYQEFIDSAITRDFNLFEAVGKNAKTIGDIMPVFDRTYALNMLNTKYIIYNPDAPPIINPKALGNAWFVEKPEFVPDADHEISMTCRTDASKTAIIDKRFSRLVTASYYTPAEGDRIELTSYKANELIYMSKAASERLAVFSDIYYPAGWKCYIDGKESLYFRADYILRAMIVPGGDHVIRFYFRPDSYYTGNMISLISSIILFLAIAGYVVVRIRKK